MDLKAIFILAVTLLTSVLCQSEESATAKLLVSKQVLNKYLVESMDVVVKYTIYNIGNSVATNVVVSDSSFPPEAFEIQGGQFKFVIDRVAPQTNVTHVVIVQPKSYGAFNFSFAEVSYKASENAEDAFVLGHPWNDRLISGGQIRDTIDIPYQMNKMRNQILIKKVPK